MPKLGITDLPDPAERYRPDGVAPCERGGKCFETLAEARKEDLARARRIRRACRNSKGLFDRAAALELADLLEASGKGDAEVNSLASKLHMGRLRHRICGALWELVDVG